MSSSVQLGVLGEKNIEAFFMAFA